MAQPTKENKTAAKTNIAAAGATSEVAGTHESPTTRLVDNRPAAVAQRKVQAAADAYTSSLPAYSKSFTPFVDNRPAAVAQRKLQETVNDSPQVKETAQMKATAR